MKAFVSIREAAEYLGVEYKTVYRLVKSGEIPAGKIGGVYRIKKEDLDEYFEKQKEKTLLESQATLLFKETCSCCRTGMVSRLSVAGRCEVCGEPICTTCWAIDGRRFCQEHQPLPSEPEARSASSDEALPGDQGHCARCRRIIPHQGMIAGQCVHPSCEEPLCRLCWQDEEDRFCAQHMPSRKDRLQRARAKLKQGKIPALVSSEEARQKELAFLSRFDLKVRQLNCVISPLQDRPLPVDSWDALHSSTDLPLPASLAFRQGVAAHHDRSDLVPCNCGSRYDIPVSGGKKRADSRKALILEAVTYSHLPEFLARGFDTQPGSLPELVSLLDEYVHRSERENCPYLLGLASPTGWDEAAQAYIQNNTSGHSFRHRLLMPVLIDLARDGVVRNELDSRLVPFLPLFSPRLPDEEIQEVADLVVQKLVGRAGLSVSEIAEELMVAPETVLRAFHHLAEPGDYRLDDLPDIGVVISKE